jgi:predicted phage baseplate assembly protein
LINSQPDDTHYRLMHDENGNAVIEFGDGSYGRVPRRGQNNITANYHVGGGTVGNVPSKSINRAVTDIPDLQYVYNVNPASGGAEAEEISDAVRRAPQQYRAMDRAVTVRDYEFHARQFGVAKAAAQSRGWNTIELFIAPMGGGQPTDTLKDDLRAFFDSRRMMTSIVAIEDPNYIPVLVMGELRVEPYYYEQQVQAQVEESVRALLTFEQVDFGDTLYISKFYEAIEAIEGVRSINISQFTRCDAPDISLCEGVTPALPTDGLIRFEWNEIPVAAYNNGIQLSVIGGAL